jgi:hypothetical protein
MGLSVGLASWKLGVSMWRLVRSRSVMSSEHVSGQTDNGACGDLVCETEALRLCVVVLVHISFGAHRSDLQAPARSLRAGPAISVLAPCAVQPLPSFWCLHLPSRESALISSSRCCPFLSHPQTQTLVSAPTFVFSVPHSSSSTC